MEIYPIRRTRGPSLFASTSSLFLSLSLSQQEQMALESAESKIIESFEVLAQSLLRFQDVKLQKVEGHNLYLSGISILVEAILRELDSFESEVEILADQSGDLFHIIIKQYNYLLEVQVVRLALQLANCLLPESEKGLLPQSYQSFYSMAFYKKYFEELESLKKSRSTQQIVRYLIDNNLPWLPMDSSLDTINQMQLGYAHNQQVLVGSTAFQSSHVGVAVSKSKYHSQQFLAELGFPTTEQQPANSLPEAKQAAQRIGFPVVLKAEYGAHGDGVVCDLRNAEELAQAYQEIVGSAKQSQSLVVEKHLSGNDYRITIVAGKYLSSFRKTPARVIGDGKNNIVKLIEIENSSPFRGSKDSKERILINLELGSRELLTLRNQGFEPGFIPQQGQEVLLRTNANFSTGGTYEIITERVHPDNIMLAKKAAEALGIDLLGVDVMTDDISKSYLENDLKIIEVNHSPGIAGYYDTDGNYLEESMDAVKLLVPNLEEKGIPIIVICGDAYLDDVGKQISTNLLKYSYHPGVVNSTGMYVGKNKWANPDSLDYRDPAFAMLRNKDVDLGIINRSTIDLIDQGVGIGGCDISIMLDSSNEVIYSDRWLRGVSSKRAAELLFKESRKVCIVCLDDPVLADASHNVSLEKLCVFSVQSDNSSLTQLLDRGVSGVFLDKKQGNNYLFKAQRFGQNNFETIEMELRNEEVLIGALCTLCVLMSLDKPFETIHFSS